jgi:invasion protein IalB
VNQQSGQTLVAIEMGTVEGNRVEGMLLTAFGLRLDAGVQLGIDGQKLGEPAPFLTCLQMGCLVPLAFDEVALSALKVGNMLEVTGVNSQNGEPVLVTLSLAGFTAAQNRTAELVK